MIFFLKNKKNQPTRGKSRQKKVWFWGGKIDQKNRPNLSWKGTLERKIVKIWHIQRHQKMCVFPKRNIRRLQSSSPCFQALKQNNHQTHLLSWQSKGPPQERRPLIRPYYGTMVVHSPLIRPAISWGKRGIGRVPWRFPWSSRPAAPSASMVSPRFFWAPAATPALSRARRLEWNQWQRKCQWIFLWSSLRRKPVWGRKNTQTQKSRGCVSFLNFSGSGWSFKCVGLLHLKLWWLKESAFKRIQKTITSRV